MSNSDQHDGYGTAGVGALAVAAVAFGGGASAVLSSDTEEGPTGTQSAKTGAEPAITEAQAARFLLRASLYASDGEIAAIRSEGYGPWLDRKMRLDNNRTGARFMRAKGFEVVDANRWYGGAGPGDRMIWSQLLQGSNSVRKRAALALSEIIVVSLNSIPMPWKSSAITAYWDILNLHAFGNYRSLLQDIVTNPAMGVFLNTRGNKKGDPATGRVPDENFGREIMQLFTIGLYELNQDGSLRLDGNGQPIETYDNDDVTGIAKCFTGYDFDYAGIGFTPDVDGTKMVEDADYAYRPMTTDTSRWKNPKSGADFHSRQEKRFLGTVIPAGTGPRKTLRLTLDALFNHPNVGPFVGRQLIQRLVTSNPSGAYVSRVAAAFNDNGAGVRGDLAAVFKAVLTDPEALADANLTSATFGKLREPMLRYVQWARTFGARSASGKYEIGDLSDPEDKLGQAPLRSPSVFNFFRPGYIPQNTTTAQADLVAPEMQLVNESSVAGYVNFMEKVVSGDSFFTRDVAAQYREELKIAHDAQALMDRLDLLLTANQMADDTKALILSVMQSYDIDETTPDDLKLRRIHAGVFLVMISNDYLIQR